jgi:hypothetical protein
VQEPTDVLELKAGRVEAESRVEEMVGPQDPCLPPRRRRRGGGGAQAEPGLHGAALGPLFLDHDHL